jgi:hypothetical protein
MINHKIDSAPFDDFSELVNYMALNRSIYFSPARRVMPCKFFLGWSWNNSSALLKHFEKGNFYSSVSYSQIMRRKIQEAVKSCPTITVTTGGKYIIQRTS